VLGYLAFARGELESATTLCLCALESCRRLGYLQFAAYALETLAGVAAVRGRLCHSARLIGSALAISERIGRAPEPTTQTAPQGVVYDWEARAVKRVLARARRDLGLKSWDKELLEGRTLNLDDAMAYATAMAAEPESVAPSVA
jgi:hypothetical protein